MAWPEQKGKSSEIRKCLGMEISHLCGACITDSKFNMGVNPPETITSTCDGWCFWVPAEVLGTQIQVKITLYGNFPAGICEFMGFS